MSLFGENLEPTSDSLAFKNIDTEKHTYKLVKEPSKIQNLIDELNKHKTVCFDTETSGIDKQTAVIVGASFSFKKGEAYYVPLGPQFEKAKEELEVFRPFFENKEITKVAHNLKYDTGILSRYGITVEGPCFDTMIAHYLLEPELRHGMDVLAENLLGYQPVSIETLIGKKGKNQKSMLDLKPEEISDYACEDADITLQLYNELEKKIDNPDIKKLLEEIEIPLNHVLMEMEGEGIKMDEQALLNFSEELGESILKLDEEIHELAGVDFNIDSPKQLGEVLFDHLKIDEKAKKTKTGQYKTDEGTLSKLEGKHEIIPLILEYRQQRKLKNTYVDSLPKLINEKTGRIHTTYMQTVAATGRLSSNNPNLQNIPIRSEKGKEIRRAFIPKDDSYKILAADYSQIELRIIAALSGDKGMIEAFVSGHDIHAATAAKVFDVALEEVTREQRSKAKMVNFGIIYGISAFGLSQRLNIKRTEAKEIIESYFDKYPGIKEYMDKSIELARENGYVETILKRRRYLKDIHSANATVRGFAERNAINAPIQGSAADIIKIAMINVQKEMKAKNLKSKMLLQVHDELVFDMHISEEKELVDLVQREMESAIKLDVPMKVEYGIADNWLEAH